MWKYTASIGILVLSSLSYAGIEFRQTKNWGYINQLVHKEEPRDTLLIFDIDKTLLHFTKECQELNFVAQLKNCDVDLSEPETLKIVEDLKESKFTIFALTARLPVMLKITQKHFDRLGFDFKDSSPLPPSREFSAKEFPDYGISEAQTPIVEKGIYMSGATAKGKSLNMLIQEFDLNFKKIIFVDDGAQNIRSLIKTFKDMPEVDITTIYYHRFHTPEKKTKDLKSIQKLLKTR